MEQLDNSIIDSFAIGDDNVTEKSHFIKIIGVGGAGCNAVNNMYDMGIEGVNLIVSNTDLQALNNSPVKRKIQLGTNLTDGLGAGNQPERGRESAIEALDEINKVLEDNTRMLFVAAGMGGGTGTGAAPVIAKAAKEKGILTIGIITIPYSKEGKPRLRQAIKGAEEMSQCVDSLLVVNCDRIYDLYRNKELLFDDAFKIGDNVISLAAKGVAEMITKPRRYNVDFQDVKTAMTDSGCSLMGTAEAKGEGRALRAVTEALNSPLLNNNDINGAIYVLVNISASPSAPLKLDEYEEIQTYVYEQAGGDDNENVQVIWGAGSDCDDVEEGGLRVTVIATGFSQNVFEVKSEKCEFVDLTPGAQSEVEKNVDVDDEEKAQTLEFVDEETQRHNKICDGIYGAGKKSSAKSEDFDSNKLRPATSMPLDKMTEEVLRNIEQTPAYKRRAN